MDKTSGVLITGGTGMIGRVLTALLLERGYRVALLSRSPGAVPGVKTYGWNPATGALDEEAFAEMGYLIHLAGANVGERRWTKPRKEAILSSRVASLRLLKSKMEALNVRPRVLVSASGISIYNDRDFEGRYREDGAQADSFLAEVTRQWEQAADEVASLGVRTVKLRTGVVLDSGGGVLDKMAFPARFGLGAVLGSGRQWIPWIHVEDLCRLYIEALENPGFEGVYNAVAPGCVTNRLFTVELCRVLKRPLWAPAVPGFVIKALFGEMGNLVLNGCYVDNFRIRTETSFQYRFPELRPALEELLGKRAQ